MSISRGFFLPATVFLFLVQSTVPAPADASGRGHVTGAVLGSESGKPMPFANVVVLGTHYGAMSLQNGNYTISNLPVGTYNIMATYIGYESQTITGVRVDAGRTTRIDFSLKQVIVGTADTIFVTADEFQLDRKSSAMSQVIDSYDLIKGTPVTGIIEVISMQAGVISQAGELHVRGGRAGETKFLIDGIEIEDPLFGGTTSFADLAISDTELLSGGFDAEFGNAQSGIVNLTTKEGGSEFSGDVRFHTDDFGDEFKTYNNFDQLQVGFGGPTPVSGLAYYLNYQGTYEDTYLKTRERRSRRRFLDFLSLGDRQSNEMNFQMKLSYRLNPNQKLTFETLRTYGKADQYIHMWSREGYVRRSVSTTFDPDGNVLEERRGYGRWIDFPEDPTT